MSTRRRLTALAATSAALFALLGTSSQASAQPSLGRQSLSCGNGVISTTAPGGTATTNTYNSGRADATWWVGVYHYGYNGWEFAWQQQYVASVATNAGPGMGGYTGYIGAWQAVGATPGAVYQASFRATPGHYYAIVSWVTDSERPVWSWSTLNDGSVVCRA